MSKSNKFTPGPWLYRGKSNSVHESCSTHPFGHRIFVFDDDAPLRDPDLSLILAAPDLLEALEGMMGLFPTGVEDDGAGIGFNETLKQKYRNAVIASKKARGQQ